MLLLRHCIQESTNFAFKID